MANITLKDAGAVLGSRGGGNTYRIIGVDSAGADLTSGTDGLAQAFGTVIELPHATGSQFTDNQPFEGFSAEDGNQIGQVSQKRVTFLEMTVVGTTLLLLKLQASQDFWWRLGEYVPAEGGWLKRTFWLGKFERMAGGEAREDGKVQEYKLKFIPVYLETATVDSNGVGGYLYKTEIVASITPIASATDV